MATHANSTPVTVLSAQANAVACMKMTGIRNIADVLATLMQDIHGGSFRVEIDHEAGFIVIRSHKDKPARPRCGEVV